MGPQRGPNAAPRGHKRAPKGPPDHPKQINIKFVSRNLLEFLGPRAFRSLRLFEEPSGVPEDPERGPSGSQHGWGLIEESLKRVEMSFQRSPKRPNRASMRRKTAQYGPYAHDMS